ncbi:hypothetical protein EV421DRAFT_1076044 [Armillaria borealis]|uniref:Uncharacterized protein n=1 Tax=Armillaria borealis TaxID=47425 RepID=A0AA39IXD0_9AGAR|nr:hypothetical protein EV421DRAFT_247876 [Armillaria borealis]KAK0437188.1 hypothetical protein EV421DRAFT_1076044 [Armillaria borealis]
MTNTVAPVSSTTPLSTGLSAAASNTSGGFFATLSSRSNSMLSLPRIGGRSTSRRTPLNTQNATLGSDIPQLNICQSQNISGLDTTAPQISASDPANSGRVPEQIVPWDEFNRVHELILTPEKIARGMRLAPASRSNHSLSTVGRGSVNSIPGSAVGNYNETTRHNNVVNTGNNYASGYVPGHAHHLSVNTTHTTNTFRVRMHGNVSSSSVGSYWSSES